MNQGADLRKIVIILVLLIPFNSDLGWWFGPATTSYTETYLVPVGTSVAASGGRLGYPHLAVSGSLTVKSCCGYSTNDIMFGISNEVSGSKDFGVIIGTFNFKWDTGNNTEYSLGFGNRFDPSSASYHDKTVEIAVTEIGPPNSVNIYLVFEILGSVAIAVATITIISIFILLRRHKRHPKFNEGQNVTTRID